MSSLLATACACVLTLMPAQSATFIWDGSDSNNWGTAANWQGGVVAPPGANRVSIGISGTSITFANRAIYSAAQGTQVFSGSAVDSNRALFLGNGAGVSGYMEISGGVFESQSTSADGMGNAGASATLWINGGTYRKTAGSTTASNTFALVLSGGNTVLEIDAGSFEVGTLDFQNSTPTATTTGTVQLDGGLLSVGNFAKTGNIAGATYVMNLNGGTLQARADATWSDLLATTWTVQSNSVIDTQGFNVSLAEALGGAGGLTKIGTGALTLSGANTFSGGLVIKEGTVIGSGANALGGSGTGSVTLGDTSGSANATLLGGGNTFANPITIAAGGTGTLTMGNNGGSATVFSGAIALNKELTFASNSSGTVNVTGAITGSSNITITGNGTGYVQLAGNNANFTGDVTVSSGILRMGATTGLSVNNAVAVNSGATFRIIGINTTIGALSGNGTVENFALSTNATLTVGGDNTSTTFSGVFQNGNTANLSVSKVGTGTLTLQGSSTYGGNFTIASGTVKLDFDAADTSKLSDTGTLVLAGGTLELAGGSHVDAVGATSLTSNTNSIVTRTSGSAVLEMNDITVNSNATVKFMGSGIATTNNQNTNGILGAWATVTVGGVTSWAANATNADDGLIVAYTGYADIPRLGPASVVPNDPAANVRIINGGTSGPITLGSSPTTDINTLQMDASDGPAIIDPANSTDVLRLGDFGGILQTSTSGGLTIGASANDGVLTTGGVDNATPATLTLINDSAANDLTINSIIANNGGDVVSLMKQGAGRVVLAGANTFTGTVRIDEGTLLVGSVTGANTTGTLGASTVVTNNGSLVYRRTDTSFVDLAGAISGSGSVSYLGSGVSGESQYTANNASTYAGGTLIDDARVSLGSGTGFGTGMVTVADGGQLYVGTTTPIANSITVSGNGWTESAGQLGAIRFNSNNSSLTGSITLAANARITATSSATGTISGAIGGAFNVEIGENDATGTVVFSGNNGYSGTTTVTAGALRVANDNALGTTAGGTSVTSGTRVELANGVNITGEALTIRGNGGNNFGALQAVSGATATWGGAITVGDSTARLSTQANSNLIVNGNINGGGFATLIMRSENATTSVVTLGGTLTGLAANGTFALYHGVLKLGAADRIQNDAVIQLGTNLSTALAGTFDLNGHNETVARLLVEGNVVATQTVTNSSATTATLTLSSSTSYIYSDLFTGNLSVAKQGSNTLTLEGANTHTGDTSVAAGVLALANVDALQSSTLDTGASGGQNVTFTVAGTNTYNLGGLMGADDLAIGANSLSVGSNGRDTVYSGNVSGTGGLTKVGTGTLALTGGNGYTGATAVNGGTLQVGSGGSGSLSSTAVTVAGGGLAGSGTINGSVTINATGILRPGDSAGAGQATLTIAGAANDLSMGASGAEFEFRAGANGINFANQSSTFFDGGGNLNSAYTVPGNVVAGANDRVVVGDQIILIAGGVLDFDFNGYTPTVGDAFDLMDWGAVALDLNGFTYGSVAGLDRFRTGGAADNALYDLDLPSLGSGHVWDVSLFESHGIIVVVPEPSRVLLLFLALAGLIMRRRR